jgi:RNase H-like domain found in reverse transcriptase
VQSFPAALAHTCGYPCGDHFAPRDISRSHHGQCRRRTDHTCLQPCTRVLLPRVCVPGSRHPPRAARRRSLGITSTVYAILTTAANAREKAFRSLQEDILTLMSTAHPDPSKLVCVFTDASDALYSGMITQVLECHLDLPVHDQQHQPLAFTSGRFRGSQERWTIPEKETFAVIGTVTKHRYLLLAAEQFSILSDHFNLKYMYASLSLDPCSEVRDRVIGNATWSMTPSGHFV